MARLDRRSACSPTTTDCLFPWGSPPPTPTTASGCSRSCAASVPSVPAADLATRPGQAACRQGLPLRPPAEMAERTRYPSPHRPQRDRVLTTPWPTPLGGRAHGVLAGRLPKTSPPLRTKTRALPRLRRYRCRPHRPPTAVTGGADLEVKALRACVCPSERQHLGEHTPPASPRCPRRWSSTPPGAPPDRSTGNAASTSPDSSWYGHNDPASTNSSCCAAPAAGHGYRQTLSRVLWTHCERSVD